MAGHFWLNPNHADNHGNKLGNNHGNNHASNYANNNANNNASNHASNHTSEYNRGGARAPRTHVRDIPCEPILLPAYHPAACLFCKYGAV